MQTIVMYLRADNVKATLVDAWNQKLNTPPAITRGLNAELILKLLNTDGQAIPTEDLAYDRWEFVIANDWVSATPPQIRVTSGITTNKNEIHIPLLETNTAELITALGSAESNTFGCELVGFEEGSDTPGYILQFNIVVRNRRADSGTLSPTPVTPGEFVYPEIDALRTELTEAIAEKADASTIAALEESIATKAAASALTSHASDESNPHHVTATQVGAISQAALDEALESKADTSALESLENSIALKATKTELASGLATKANQTALVAVEAAVALRATKEDVSTDLAKKADKTAVEALETALAAKASLEDLESLDVSHENTFSIANDAAEAAAVAEANAELALANVINHVENLAVDGTPLEAAPHGITAESLGAMVAPTTKEKRLSGGFFISGTYDSGGGGFCGDNVTFPASRTKAPAADKLTRNANGSLYWEQARILTDGACVLKDAQTNAPVELQVRDGTLGLNKDGSFEGLFNEYDFNDLFSTVTYLADRPSAPKEYALLRIKATEEFAIPIEQDGYGAFYITVPEGLAEFRMDPQYVFDDEENIVKWFLIVDCTHADENPIIMLPCGVYWVFPNEENHDEICLPRGKRYLFEMMRIPDLEEDGTLGMYWTLGTLKMELPW